MLKYKNVLTLSIGWIYIEWLLKKVTRQFRMYTYRIRGKRGPFKIILLLLFVPS